MSEDNPFMPKGLGEGDTKSGEKAKKSHERTKSHNEAIDSEGWPRGVGGQPMMKVVMTASELIPTGQYANCSIGPVSITCFVDQARSVDGGYFDSDERDTVAQALNELAEIVEGDVVAVQRSLVLENLQSQKES